MELYLDSAIIEEVEEINSWGIISGITTNPTLIAKAGKDFKETVIKICEIIKGPVSAEVTCEDLEGMIKQGKEIARWHDSIVIKLPCNVNGLKACKELSNDGIQTNLTLCFSVNQALLCSAAGASFISPFIGRLEDINHNGIELIREIKEVFEKHNIKTKIIAASVRTPEHVSASALAGADIATIPYTLFDKLINHPLTEKGIEKFMSDWKKTI